MEQSKNTEILSPNKDMIKVNPKDAIERAKINLVKAKAIDEEKKDYVWISKEKTQKLIHKSKLKECLNDGWKLNNSKK